MKLQAKHIKSDRVIFNIGNSSVEFSASPKELKAFAESILKIVRAFKKK